jgi:hypothetical protein
MESGSWRPSHVASRPKKKKKKKRTKAVHSVHTLKETAECCFGGKWKEMMCDGLCVCVGVFVAATATGTTTNGVDDEPIGACARALRVVEFGR